MDPNEKLHSDWIGMAQPEGLVVTVATLKQAEANITWPVAELQATLREFAGGAGTVTDLPGFFREVLDWDEEFVVGPENIPTALHVRIEGEEPLVPTYAVRSADEADSFALLVSTVRSTVDLDAANEQAHWTASAHQRFERLLREAGVAVGLLTNGRNFRLVYAPRGESAGHVTFRVSEMLTGGEDGRVLLGALHMLLNQKRLLSLEPERRLAGLLRATREYQNTVSNALRDQVLGALRELLRGFEAADRLREGALLGDWRREHRQEIYGGLVTALMRLVFVLYAEERRLLPMDAPLYAQSYSLTELHKQLVRDHGVHGSLDERYGAWARVVALFRLVHDGVQARGLFLPPRHGALFDPDRYAFLEGRRRGSVRQTGERGDVPRVSDGVVYRVLDGLVVLAGERLQYRGLDVEQIGSVYEGLMGFELEVAEGDSMALTSAHVVVDLEALLAKKGAERAKVLKSDAGVELPAKSAAGLRDAKTVAELQAALERRAAPHAGGLIPRGSLFLQPGEERRRSGSHYTPRKLTQPIVETTLRPVLERLGAEVTPERILALKVCDPAMGSGAFLVEACRQLAEHLVAAWQRTGTTPVIPADEEPLLHARRLVATQCLYGVDKNPMAVDLARLSLWLVTMARDHAFTFVDHALRCGDSLVGLSREQIASFALAVDKRTQLGTVRALLDQRVKVVEGLRREIQSAGDTADNARQRGLWKDAEGALAEVRVLGDLVVAAFLGGNRGKEPKKLREEYSALAERWATRGSGWSEITGAVAGLRGGERGVNPFHWEIEFPEVYGRDNGGFDCVVGNPPFLGGTLIGSRLGLPYHDYLIGAYRPATGLADLIAFFLRQSFSIVRVGGVFGVIATNTAAQGDTRVAGLGSIVDGGGTILEARRRYKWPGDAAVVAVIIHVIKGVQTKHSLLDGAAVERVSSFLLASKSEAMPAALPANKGASYLGTKIWGAGFVFEEDPSDGSSSIEVMEQLVTSDPRNKEVIFAYMGGEEFNSSPTQVHRRFVIDFGDMTREEAMRWPPLFDIVEERVRPIRAGNKQRNYRDQWWLHANRVPEAAAYLNRCGRIMALTCVSKHLAVAFVYPKTVVANSMVLILRNTNADFAVMQSRPHEAWARLLGSSMKDDLRYTTVCFDTFPCPAVEGNPELNSIGERYYTFRADLMVRNNEGLTKTYNRFHSPDERSPEIARLRALHAEMDRAVLDAYGWTDLRPEYDFRPQLDESVRYTWSEDTRDEVLARLLELNRVIAEREAAEAAAAKPAKGAKPAAKRGARKKGPPSGSESDGESGTLFSED